MNRLTIEVGDRITDHLRQETASWLFIIGSVFFLIGPILRTLNKH